MDPNQETFTTWNSVALKYQEKFMDMPYYNASYDLFCEMVAQREARLLEIGCGPGNITKYLLAKRPDFSLFGIDIAPNMIALAKANNPTADFAVMDCREIHTLESNFDALIAGFCIPYLSPSECATLFASAYQLLAPQGWMYLSFVAGEREQSGFQSGSAGRVYFHYHPLEQLVEQLQHCQFALKNTLRVKYPTSDTTFDWHTILLVQKI
ncbi:MAG: hypothetical protein RLZZ500_2230 [Bacteroidota bacterium]